MCLSFVTRKCNVIFSSTPSSTPSYKYIFCNIFSQDEFIAIQKPNQHIQTDWFIWQGGLPFIDYWMLSTPYCTALQGPAWINDYTRYIYTCGINLHVFSQTFFMDRRSKPKSNFMQETKLMETFAFIIFTSSTVYGMNPSYIQPIQEYWRPLNHSFRGLTIRNLCFKFRTKNCNLPTPLTAHPFFCVSNQSAGYTKTL